MSLFQHHHSEENKAEGGNRPSSNESAHSYDGLAALDGLLEISPDLLSTPEGVAAAAAAAEADSSNAKKKNKKKARRNKVRVHGLSTNFIRKKEIDTEEARGTII